MKTAFYQLEGDGNWILSPDINDQVKGNYYLKDLKFDNGVWNLGIMDPKDNSYLIASKPITDYTKENGREYRSPEEIERVCGRFFGATSVGTITTDGFLYLPTTIAVKGLRIGERAGFTYAIDQVLTATGFAGVENTDWVNVGGQAIV